MDTNLVSSKFEKVFIVDTLTIGYVFDYVVMKGTLNIIDSPLYLEVNWEEVCTQGMKNMVVEMIIRGTFKVVDLTSLILLVRDILSQCLLYY
jgi:hypothetical protein